MRIILKIILLFIFLISTLLIGCATAGKGYQEHGWAKVVSGTSGNMSFSFYEPATLTQREIDSLNSLPEESQIDTGTVIVINGKEYGETDTIKIKHSVYIDTLIMPRLPNKKKYP